MEKASGSGVDGRAGLPPKARRERWSTSELRDPFRAMGANTPPPKLHLKQMRIDHDALEYTPLTT